MKMWMAFMVGLTLLILWIAKRTTMVMCSEVELEMTYDPDPVASLREVSNNLYQLFKAQPMYGSPESKPKKSREISPPSNQAWKRRALRLIATTAQGLVYNSSSSSSSSSNSRQEKDKHEVEDGESERCSQNISLDIPSSQIMVHFNDYFVDQIRTIAKFNHFLENFLSSLQMNTVSEEEAVAVTFIKLVLDSDFLFHGCALYLDNNDRGDVDPGTSSSPSTPKPSSSATSSMTSKTSSSSSLIYAYRDANDNRSLCLKKLNNSIGTPSSFMSDASLTSSCKTTEDYDDRNGDLMRQMTADFKRQLAMSNNLHVGSAWDSIYPANKGKWTSPWYHCATGSWIITYALPIFTTNNVWRGVIMIHINLRDVDINQCSQSNALFGDTNLCHRDTMQCVHFVRSGFRRGAYQCVCRPGHYFPNVTDSEGGIANHWDSYFNGTLLETKYGDVSDEDLQEFYDKEFRCLPCQPGCQTCQDGSPCYVKYDILWRGVPLGLQSFCMTITVVLGICVFQLRKCKVIATGMWTVLEMILVGAMLLYSTVVIRYFEPETLTCFLEPWFREMGFAIFYGTIILKMYRILVEFRTRKAHRWVIRDKDLLKYLAGIILIVVGYMSAWTAISVDHIYEGDSIIDIGETEEEKLKYTICKSRWWDYVTETGEFTFLLFGTYISYHIRNANSPYQEKRYLCLAIYIEMIVSLSLHVFRHHTWLSLHPDYIFLMYFGRCQLTVSVTLIFIFGPKLWYHYKPPRDGDVDHGRITGDGGGHDHAAPEVLKLQDGITSNGEVDIGEINLADMDPEDIRAELRRVYTQLQVLRNKTMRKDNPHISKRRGGRKATHRRFSLQAFHRHRHHHDQEHETDVSKTPEESTGSADGIGVPGNDPTNDTNNVPSAGNRK